MSRSVVNYDRSGNSKVNRASEKTTTGEISSLNMDESESAVSESTHGRSSQHFHTICSHLSLRVDWRESLLSTVRDRRFSGNRILHRLAMVLLVLDLKMPFDLVCPTSYSWTQCNRRDQRIQVAKEFKSNIHRGTSYISKLFSCLIATIAILGFLPVFTSTLIRLDET